MRRRYIRRGDRTTAGGTVVGCLSGMREDKRLLVSVVHRVVDIVAPTWLLYSELPLAIHIIVRCADVARHERLGCQDRGRFWIFRQQRHVVLVPSVRQYFVGEDFIL